MKRLIVAAAGIALLAGAGTASAQTRHKGYSAPQGHFVQRPVRMQSTPDVPPPNADLKYGPQPDYPWSPPGGS